MNVYKKSLFVEISIRSSIRRGASRPEVGVFLRAVHGYVPETFQHTRFSDGAACPTPYNSIETLFEKYHAVLPHPVRFSRTTYRDPSRPASLRLCT